VDVSSSPTKNGSNPVPVKVACTGLAFRPIVIIKARGETIHINVEIRIVFEDTGEQLKQQKHGQ
jgi:hypothetical protein